MIKDILNSNEKILPNSKQIEVLKENFPACFKSDGSFDIERFKEYISDKLILTNEGYELKFLGKNYARLLASIDTTTVIVPDYEHNNKLENKDSKNIYISGDNLDGLKQLLKSYSGQVKCIYIDPPYNTGSDGFIYNDNFNFSTEDLARKLSIDEEKANRILELTKRGSASHSAWLMFMYPRLLLARDLLKKDGVIFISIDDNEQSNLKLLCDDVFGEENIVVDGIVIVKTEGRSYGGFAKTHEHFIVYSKNSDLLALNEINIEGKEFKFQDEYGGFNIQDLRNQNSRAFNDSNRPNLRYPIYVNTSKEDNNGFYDISLDYVEGYEEVYPIITKGYKSVWRWGKAPGEKARSNTHNICARRGSDNIIRVYEKMRKITEKPKSVMINNTFLSNRGTNEVSELLGEGIFDFPKPVGLILELLKIGSDKDSIILDFFSGSATTANAVMKLNAEDNGERKYILVQLSEEIEEGKLAYKAGYQTIDEIGIERIIRAGKKIKEDYPETTADIGFKHYTLKEPAVTTLDKLEKFIPEEQGMFVLNDILSDFGTQTVLTTWLVRDGYGFNACVNEIDFVGYKGYYIDKHLYLIDPDISKDSIMAIVDKYETDGEFNPENVVLFGYSFIWTKVEELKMNLARLKDTEKNLHINFDVRY